jgi:curved DNA-binding protein CbpA
MTRNYYEILGVPRDAPEQQIKAAYHRLARVNHPDKAMDPGSVAAMETEMSVISAAYNVLKDKDKRASYDRTLGGQRPNDTPSPAGPPSTPPTGSPLASTIMGSSMPTAGQTPGAGGQGGFDQSRASVAKRAFAKGVQLYNAGEFAKAAEFFEVAINNNDREAAYHARLAQALLRGQRSFSRATEAVQRAIAIDPYGSEYRLILAEIYETASSPSMALKTYEDIVKWDPTNQRALAAIDVLKPKKPSNFLSRFFGRKG